MADPISPAARTFGERVRRARLELALSQEEIANLAGMQVSNYGKIERGLGNPNMHTIIRIAGVMGINPADFMNELGLDSLPPKHEAYSAKDFIAERRQRNS